MRRLSLLVLLLAPLTLADTPGCPTNYGYSGYANPSQWQYLPGSLCGSEPLQSPIDISRPFGAERGKPITVRYQTMPLTVVNSGHDFRVIPTRENSISVDGVEATLDNFHFHTPSEHTMNGGRPTAGEIHFVHQDPKTKKIYVIAVLLQLAKRDNRALQPIIRQLPIRLCKTEETKIELAPLLPKTITSYYRYVGSLTTPKCDGNVTFYLLPSPMPISARQRDVLRTFGNNARPLQQRHGRPITRVRP
jgi:carbonic anhydrase